MKYDNFRRMVLNHLVEYKHRELKISDSGFFGKKKYDHILPKGHELENYLFNDIETINGLKSFKKHNNWMHLNSSQTMCVNYFANLIKNGYFNLNKILTKIIGKETNISYHEFEYSPEPRSTNFDFYCKDLSGHEYFFEIKYTENGFEKCSQAKSPGDEFKRTYEPLINDNGYLKDVKCSDFMCNHYQCYRNLLMANESKGNYCFFITMKANSSTYDEIEQINKDLGGRQLNNVKYLYWEELIDMTINLLDQDKEYYKRFKNKYIPSNLE